VLLGGLLALIAGRAAAGTVFAMRKPHRVNAIRE
jgi:hypothetical protein